MKPIDGYLGGRTDPATDPAYLFVYVTAISLYGAAQRLADEHGPDHPEVVHTAQRAHRCLMGAYDAIRRARDAARPKPLPPERPTLFDDAGDAA